jgi:hypothetical protein
MQQIRRANCTTDYIQYNTASIQNFMMTSNDNKQMIEKKIGEALGLEMAAQKAVEELGSKGLLDKAGMKDKLEKMRKQANNHQTDLEELILLPSLGLDSSNIQEAANETSQKASEMMKTYLGETLTLLKQ